MTAAAGAAAGAAVTAGGVPMVAAAARKRSVSSSRCADAMLQIDRLTLKLFTPHKVCILC